MQIFSCLAAIRNYSIKTKMVFSNFTTVEDTSQIVFKNNAQANINARFLRFSLEECNNVTSMVPCAGKDEIDEYMKNHKMELWSIKSFVDYSQVDPGVGPIM